ncbi:outer membrane protein transport protein [Postechiella marina]|uniref:Outer membrane protein transport protein n=2 Tax=Postechiella marina TaxID=943941 RepID=A0ABP8CG32_9FLAO
MPLLNAQDITDALRYSQSEVQGTARFRALSGAFGALGGDMSAVSINPAGSAVFSQSHASFSVNILDYTNDTQYFGGEASTNNSDFSLNQGGASFVFRNNNTSSPWKKFTIGVAYDKTSDYEDDWFAAGINTNVNTNFDNTIASYFFDYANGLPLGDISTLEGESIADAYADIGAAYGFGHQQAFLGFESYILQPVDIDDDNNTEYLINLENGNFTHDYSYLSTGYNGKIAFNMAAQYGDNLYLGINLNSHFIDYERSTRLYETNGNGGLINEIDFRNTLRTTGNGFSFQIGSIIKLSKELRLGLTYDSPTWYTIEEETTQFLDTSELVAQDLDVIDPGIINVYPEYKLQTPAKFTGSLAYVVGKQGLISFDYSRKDYGNAKFKPTGDFTAQNNQINSELAAAATYRLGGEYKYEQFSFRGGYRFEESPYENGTTVGDLNGYSLGVGYNFGNTRFDITFDQYMRDFETPMFNQGLTSPILLDKTNSNITLSLSFNI